MQSLTLIIVNDSIYPESFFILQKPATISPASNYKVISRSLGTNNLSSSAAWQMYFDTNIYAGATGPIYPYNSEIHVNAVNQVITSTTVVNQIITVGAPNTYSTNLSINPLALSPPSINQGVQPGSFGIKITSYTPSIVETEKIYIGGAFIDASKTTILSYSIEAPPSQLISFQPNQIFYVSQGTTALNEQVDLSSLPTYAICDFSVSSPTPTIVATYAKDGTWKVDRTK
jgi:hypothetical protein